MDPYPLVGPGRALEFPFGLLYPLPAAVAAIPLAPLAAAWGNAAFMALGVGLFAWAVTARGWEPALGLASASVLFAVETGQWSPLLAASVVLTPVGVFLACKPTIGAAMFFARPTWWPVVGGIVMLAVAFGFVPHWVTSWRTATAMRSTFAAPVLFPGGAAVLLALARWRRPEARLLVALACVPQTTLLYETVPLFLIPRSLREAAVLTLASYGVAYWTVRYGGAQTYADSLTVSGQAITLALYLPCTLMVLRRQNVGSLPVWLEARITRWPTWLRGHGVVADA
jgi:hypothetical protein